MHSKYLYNNIEYILAILCTELNINAAGADDSENAFNVDDHNDVEREWGITFMCTVSNVYSSYAYKSIQE